MEWGIRFSWSGRGSAGASPYQNNAKNEAYAVCDL